MARTVAALKCFFPFLLENEQLDRDPALVLRTPKKREALPASTDYWMEKLQERCGAQFLVCSF